MLWKVLSDLLDLCYCCVNRGLPFGKAVVLRYPEIEVGPPKEPTGEEKKTPDGQPGSSLFWEHMMVGCAIGARNPGSEVLLHPIARPPPSKVPLHFGIKNDVSRTSDMGTLRHVFTYRCVK